MVLKVVDVFLASSARRTAVRPVPSCFASPATVIRLLFIEFASVRFTSSKSANSAWDAVGLGIKNSGSNLNQVKIALEPERTINGVSPEPWWTINGVSP
jgi:hypothetical protein